MKQLLLIRHAKSDWADSSLKDFDRPLNKRGKENAPEMANRLLQKSLIPQCIITSPALRAKSTAHFFADTFGFSKDLLQEDKRIYEASPSTLLDIVNHFDNQYNFIALIGHNPGLTQLLITLSNSDIYNIPTCGMALIEFPFDNWNLLSAGTGDLRYYDYPKNKEGQSLD
ncbi:SixA phosphatase family protein [Rubrolithibacter danxiaensis]|uniref:SixA phosphatase family protein n=1 Tax=Rubrolithibacter danxiaensis TaxID=3390805 RepID=UPI003BF8FD23